MAQATLNPLGTPDGQAADTPSSRGWTDQRSDTIVRHFYRIRYVLIVAAVVFLLDLTFLTSGTLLTGVVRQTRPSTPLSSLVAGHLFEHTVDYLLVACFALAISRAFATSRTVVSETCERE